jgi:cytochrome c oxidase assembly factor CtaG
VFSPLSPNMLAVRPHLLLVCPPVLQAVPIRLTSHAIPGTHSGSVTSVTGGTHSGSVTNCGWAIFASLVWDAIRLFAFPDLHRKFHKYHVSPKVYHFAVFVSSIAGWFMRVQILSPNNKLCPFIYNNQLFPLIQYDHRCVPEESVHF